MLISFRGRCTFKMYMSNNSTKYGIKLTWLIRLDFYFLYFVYYYYIIILLNKYITYYYLYLILLYLRFFVLHFVFKVLTFGFCIRIKHYNWSFVLRYFYLKKDFSDYFFLNFSSMECSLLLYTGFNLKTWFWKFLE